MSSPSIFTQLFTLSKAVLTQVAAGCPQSVDEEIERRSKICSECPSLMKETYQCGECKCFLKYKIPWKTSKCPLNKWPDLMKKEKSSENKDM